MKLNQFQELTTTKQKRTFLIDFLIGDVREITAKTIKEVNDDEMQQLEKQYIEKLEEIKCIPEEYLTVVLIPTYGCNLRCEYCYEGSLTYSADYSKLDILKVIQSIIIIKNYYSYQNISFVMLGGEPILRNNLMWFKNFFSQFTKTGIPYEVKCISNGVEVYNEINSLKEIGVTNIQITLDGMEECQNIRRPSKDKKINVFKNIVKGIDTLLLNEITVNVRINVDDQNVTELPKMHKFFYDKGWWKDENFFAYVYPISFSGNDLTKKYLNESEIFKLVTDQLLLIPDCLFDLDFHGISFINSMLNQEIFYPSLTFCEATTNQIVFDDKGNISTCWWGTNIDDFVLGTLNTVDSKEFMNKLEKWKSRDITKIEECITCKYKFICGGGCSYKAYLEHSNFLRGRCSTFSENIKVYLEYLIDAGKL